MSPISAAAPDRRQRALMLVVTASLLLLAACANSSEPGQNGTANDTTEAGADNADGGEATSQADGSGQAGDLLSFRAGTVDGGQLDGAELAGKPVAMWFWAPW